MSNHHAGDVVAVWAASGHHLTRMSSTGSSISLDRRDEQLIGDVIADHWVYPARRVIAPQTVSDSAAVERRTGVILL